jgi:hypothetical protein
VPYSTDQFELGMSTPIRRRDRVVVRGDPASRAFLASGCVTAASRPAHEREHLKVNEAIRPAAWAQVEAERLADPAVPLEEPAPAHA